MADFLIEGGEDVKLNRVKEYPPPRRNMGIVAEAGSERRKLPPNATGAERFPVRGRATLRPPVSIGIISHETISVSPFGAPSKIFL